MRIRRILFAAQAALLTFVLAAAPLRADVLAHWSFDETTGSTVADTAGGHTATLQGSGDNLNVAGQFGSGISLNGSGWLNVASFTGFQDSNFTVSSWVNLTTTSGPQELFAKWYSPFEFRFDLTSGSNLRNSLGQDIVAGTTNLGATNAWHMVTWTWDRDAGKLKYYIDGTLTTTLNETANGIAHPDINHSGGAYNIGRKGDSGQNFHGSIDELWVINKALTPTQIASLRDYNDANHVQLSATQSIIALAAAYNNSTGPINITFTDPATGESVTLALTMTPGGSGSIFKLLDGNTRVGELPNDSGNWVSLGENVNFTASVVSATSNVDLSSISFRIDGLGYRTGNTTSAFNWTSSTASQSNVALADADDALTPTLDSLLFTFNGGTYTANYAPVLTHQQLSDLNATGLHMTAVFAVVPAPAALPAGLALMGLITMRRRK
ncbi:MAG: hypothetical protein GC162_04640 [Planctomycetes bacterium]|nr:hypothetical protein [Planctomycetota bacterium]